MGGRSSGERAMRSRLFSRTARPLTRPGIVCTTPHDVATPVLPQQSPVTQSPTPRKGKVTCSLARAPT
eukprot:scaffold52540_cov33-Phaeocystis_antarctica.AAC.1